MLKRELQLYCSGMCNSSQWFDLDLETTVQIDINTVLVMVRCSRCNRRLSVKVTFSQLKEWRVKNGT